MDPLAPLRAIWAVPGTVVHTAGRALEDLNTLAERARREPDPVEQVRQRADALLTEAATLIDQLHALIDRGADLTDVARSLDRSLLVFRQALPRVLEGLDTVEGLESAAETVAETVEPLAGVADRVGRVSDRLTRGRRRPDGD